MSNELKLNVSVRAEKGSWKFERSLGQLQVDMANAGEGGYTQNIGTSEEVIGGLSDVTTFGWALFRNLDATQYVEIGPESGGSMVSFAKLLAGEFALLPLTPGITIRAQANTSAVGLEVHVLER